MRKENRLHVNPQQKKRKKQPEDAAIPLSHRSRAPAAAFTMQWLITWRLRAGTRTPMGTTVPKIPPVSGHIPYKRKEEKTLLKRNPAVRDDGISSFQPVGRRTHMGPAGNVPWSCPISPPEPRLHT
jgi:hypothetical protein